MMQIPTTGPAPNRTVVPFPAPQVPQVYLAMAAAQMHAEGRLFEPATKDKPKDTR